MGLGMFDVIPKIIEGVITISPGDKLICYTDGLVEAENLEQQEFGVTPIETIISLDVSIESTIDLLKTMLKDFIKDQHVTDDISILGMDFY
jgi:serine phosphatase RsbU (regulator of sigma subunit)